MFKRFAPSAVIFAAGFALCAVIGGKSFAFLSQEPPTQQTPCKPQSWEYHLIAKEIEDKRREVDAELKALGSAGFEIVSVTQSGSSARHVATIILRRPKQ